MTEQKTLSSNKFKKNRNESGSKSMITSKKWIDDDLRQECQACFQNFHSVFKRKHHCRICGEIFCRKCTSKSYHMEKEKKIRICFKCQQLPITIEETEAICIPDYGEDDDDDDDDDDEKEEEEEEDEIEKGYEEDTEDMQSRKTKEKEKLRLSLNHLNNIPQDISNEISPSICSSRSSNDTHQSSPSLSEISSPSQCTLLSPLNQSRRRYEWSWQLWWKRIFATNDLEEEKEWKWIHYMGFWIFLFGIGCFYLFYYDKESMKWNLKTLFNLIYHPSFWFFSFGIGKTIGESIFLKSKESTLYIEEWNQKESIETHPVKFEPIQSQSQSQTPTTHEITNKKKNKKKIKRKQHHVTSRSSIPCSDEYNLRVQTCEMLAKEALQTLSDMAGISCTKSWEWQDEKSSNNDVKTWSCRETTSSNARIFKCSVDFQNLSSKDLFEILHFGLRSSPEWNPTLADVQIYSMKSFLQAQSFFQLGRNEQGKKQFQNVSDTNEDICTITSTIAAEAAGGLVSAREFWNVRGWRKLSMTKDGYNGFITGGKGIEENTRKKMKKKTDKKEKLTKAALYLPLVQNGNIRGFTGPSGFVIYDLEESKHSTSCSSRLIWIVNSDLKGWLPRRLIDQAITGVMTDFIEALKKHIEGKKIPVKNE